MNDILFRHMGLLTLFNYFNFCIYNDQNVFDQKNQNVNFFNNSQFRKQIPKLIID